MTAIGVNERISRYRHVLRTVLKKAPLLKRMYGEYDLFRKYGRIRPTRVLIKGTKHVLYADPREERGRALLRGGCAGQPHTKRVWLAAIKELHPDVVLDVGVNYGEFLFAPEYGANVRVIGVEANPRLHPWLQQSLVENPHRDRISLHGVLAGEAEAEKTKFYLDPAWSGRSSAVQRGCMLEQVVVPTRTMDSLCGLTPGEAFVFKLDVEGFEAKVLRGMKRTLENAGPTVGLIEFDVLRIRESGEDPWTMLRSLTRRYQVRAIDTKGRVEKVLAPDASGQDIVRRSLLSEGHWDLLVTSSEQLMQTMLGVLEFSP